MKRTESSKARKRRSPRCFHTTLHHVGVIFRRSFLDAEEWYWKAFSERELSPPNQGVCRARLVKGVSRSTVLNCRRMRCAGTIDDVSAVSA